jgi:hypothetical protein
VRIVLADGKTGITPAMGLFDLLRDLQAQGLKVTTVDDAVRLLRSGERNAVRLARTASRLLGEAIAVTVNLSLSAASSPPRRSTTSQESVKRSIGARCRLQPGGSK